MKVAKTRTKRAMSPVNGHQSANPSRSLHLNKDKVVNNIDYIRKNE